ncbi:hypothetical protein DFH09DRAFT_1463656 [Mycena vulgaris]|nr:hypothetical protein DFH09DRAFT_1463656 [Mycena vulgaris]
MNDDTAYAATVGVAAFSELTLCSSTQQSPMRQMSLLLARRARRDPAVAYPPERCSMRRHIPTLQRSRHCERGNTRAPWAGSLGVEDVLRRVRLHDVPRDRRTSTRVAGPACLNLALVAVTETKTQPCVETNCTDYTLRLLFAYIVTPPSGLKADIVAPEPPCGDVEDRIRFIAQQLGLETVMWGFDAFTAPRPRRRCAEQDAAVPGDEHTQPNFSACECFPSFCFGFGGGRLRGAGRQGATIASCELLCALLSASSTCRPCSPYSLLIAYTLLCARRIDPAPLRAPLFAVGIAHTPSPCPHWSSSTRFPFLTRLLLVAPTLPLPAHRRVVHRAPRAVLFPRPFLFFPLPCSSPPTWLRLRLPLGGGQRLGEPGDGDGCGGGAARACLRGGGRDGVGPSRA